MSEITIHQAASTASPVDANTTTTTTITTYATLNKPLSSTVQADSTEAALAAVAANAYLFPYSLPLNPLPTSPFVGPKTVDFLTPDAHFFYPVPAIYQYPFANNVDGANIASRLPEDIHVKQ